jgi:peptide/nickel transport system substrate-binding protein
MLQGRSSRRTILRRAAVLGMSVPVIGGLLAACGDDDPTATPAPAATAAPGADATPTAPAAPGADATPTGPAAPGADATATPAAAGEPTPTGATTTEPVGEGRPGGTLLYGLLRDPIGFDPHIAYGASSSSLQGNVYDTLINYDVDESLIGALAEQWEISGDALTYTLNLRQGVTFHDGADFTAADVVANFDRIRNPDNGLARRVELGNMASYEATDDHTVTISLDEPYATLLAVLATPQMHIASAEWLETVADPAVEMNGTGPFMLDSFEPQVRYTLVKNPNFWKPGLPYLDSIVQIPIADDAARVNAMRSGEINFVEYVPWQNMADFENDANYTLYKGFDTYNLVRLNPQRPPLDNKLVRQALNYAIDRDAVIAVAFGGEGEAMTTSLFPSISPWYQQELEDHWSYDPDRAAELLAEAGVDPSGITLDFAAATISVHMDTAQVVAQQIEQLGFNVNIMQQDVPTLTERRGTGDYQMMQDGLSLAYPDPDAYTVYFDIGGSAYARGVNYENQEMADLLEQGRSETDRERRKEIYLEFERVLLDEAPWIFILFRPQAEASLAKMKGYNRIASLGLGSVANLETLWFDE